MPVTTIDPPFVKPRQRSNRGVWVSRVMIFAAVVVLVDALVGEHGFAASLRARQEYARGWVRLATMRAENADLREQARRLAHDPMTIEALARTELGLVRRDEVLFIVSPVSAASRDGRPAPGGPDR